METKTGTAKSSEQSFPITGKLDPTFAPVWDAFSQGFTEGEEQGSCLAVMIDGKPVVDIWGGFKDIAGIKPWEENTICNGMSVGKGIAATCLHMLIDRGAVDLDAPVARYWPEFAAGGKEKLLVRWVLDHRSGLPLLTDDLWPGAIFDWNVMTEALAAQAPMWEPGTQPAYHIRTFGFLVGEIVRRVSGKDFSTFFRDELATPFSLDYFFGVPDSELPRCAEFIGRPDNPSMDPNSMFARAGRQWPVPLDYNSRDFRQSAIPSSNGHGTARAVARFYSIMANGGSLDGKRALSAATVAVAGSEQYWGKEAVIGRTNRQALGYLLNSPQFPIGKGKNAYGQSGMGGAMGYCDPDRKLAVGYIPNKMHAMSNIGPRIMRIIEALDRCV